MVIAPRLLRGPQKPDLSNAILTMIQLTQFARYEERRNQRLSLCLCAGAASGGGLVCVVTRRCRTAAYRNDLQHHSAARWQTRTQSQRNFLNYCQNKVFVKKSWSGAVETHFSNRTSAVVIQSLKDTPPLTDDSVIFTSDRLALGKVGGPLGDFCPRSVCATLGPTWWYSLCVSGLWGIWSCVQSTVHFAF